MLYTAVFDNNLIIVKELLVVIKKTNRGLTVLHISVQRSHTDIIKLLLEKAPELASIEDSQGQTSLHWAVSNCNKEIIVLLLCNVS